MKLCQIIRLVFCFIFDNSIPIINLQQQLITDCGFTTISRKNAISYLIQINFQIVMDSLTFTLFELLWSIKKTFFRSDKFHSIILEILAKSKKLFIFAEKIYLLLMGQTMFKVRCSIIQSKKQGVRVRLPKEETFDFVRCSKKNDV